MCLSAIEVQQEGTPMLAGRATVNLHRLREPQSLFRTVWTTLGWPASCKNQ